MSNLSTQVSSFPRNLPNARPPDVQGSAAPTLHAQASDAEEPDHDDEPRAGLSRGRDAERPLPGLSRGAGARGRGADDDRGLGGGVARLAARFQQHPGLQGRGGAVDGEAGRRLPRARLRGDDPADASRAPHALEQGRLAAGGVAEPRARGGAPGVSQEARGLGHRPDHRGLRRRGGADEGGRARRDRASGLRASDGPVLVRADQHARRALWRVARQPSALHVRGSGRGPRAGGRRFHRRNALHGGRGHGRRDHARRGS